MSITVLGDECKIIVERLRNEIVHSVVWWVIYNEKWCNNGYSLETLIEREGNALRMSYVPWVISAHF